MRKYNLGIIIGAFVLCSQMVLGQRADEQGVNMKKTGQSTMTFLQVGLVPEATALGDAYTAVGTGITSVFYNPAGLSETTERFQFFASNTSWIADINYLAGGLAWNLNNAGVVGFSFLSVDYGDIIETTLISSSEIANHPSGYNETGDMVSNVGGQAIGLTYSRGISRVFKFGFSGRLVRQQLGQSTLSTGLKNNQNELIVYDLGVKYYTPYKSFRFGMSIRNFSKALIYEVSTSQLPMTFAVGGVMDLMDFINPDHNENNSLLASAEFTHPNNYTERLHLGLGYTFNGLFSLRGGYVTNHDIKSWSGGFSVPVKVAGSTTEISYTYSDMAIFENVSRMGIIISF
ncbi:PorV/PorQ family protein [Candidatus Neomarinimicrobiota bacterium]